MYKLTSFQFLNLHAIARKLGNQAQKTPNDHGDLIISQGFYEIEDFLANQKSRIITVTFSVSKIAIANRRIVQGLSSLFFPNLLHSWEYKVQWVEQQTRVCSHQGTPSQGAKKQAATRSNYQSSFACLGYVLQKGSANKYKFAFRRQILFLDVTRTLVKYKLNFL